MLRKSVRFGLTFLRRLGGRGRLLAATAWAATALPCGFAVARGDAAISQIPDRFIISACMGHRGNIWLGTESHGVYRYNPHADRNAAWTHFTTAGGLPGNTVQAIACDAKGRIWVGTSRHGVAVFNGARWQRYGLLNDPAHHELAGPISEHINAIAVNPVDGSVWMVGNSGIAVYHSGDRPGYRKWSYITVANGLPADAVDSVAFGRRGTAYVGTQCYGLVILRRQKAIRPPGGQAPEHWARYRLWRTVSSRWKNGPPLTPAGMGLPSNLINAVLVAKNGTVWVATDEGVAWSINRGRTWRFVRGADWRKKDQQLTHPPAAIFIANAAYLCPPGQLLSGDHVNCLAEDSSGQVWLGFWRAGLNVLDPQTGVVAPPPVAWQKAAKLKPGAAPLRDDVFCALPLPRGRMLVGYFGGGIQIFSPPTGHSHAASKPPGGQSRRAAAPTPARAPMPAAAEAPTAAQLAILKTAFQKRMRVMLARHGPPIAVALDQDWITEGNWMGRYGTDWALLTAMDAPNLFEVNNGWQPNQGALNRIGAHFLGLSGLRSWVQWLYTTDRRVLEIPRGYLYNQWINGLVKSRRLDRREAEYDDHGEALPTTWQGPGLFDATEVPPGINMLSFYEYNYNGLSGPMRQRDYTFTLRRQPPSVPFGAINGFNHWPDPIRQRVVNFCGGVWVRYLVRGPGTFTLKIGRNYSLNTMVQAECLDLAVRRPRPFFGGLTKRAQRCAEEPTLAPWHYHHLGRKLPDPNALYLGLGMVERFHHPPSAILPRWAMGVGYFAEALRSDWAHRPKKLAKLSAWRQKVGRNAWLLHRYRRSEQQLARQGFTTARHIEKSLWHYSVVNGWLAVPSYCNAHGIYAADRAALKRLKASMKASTMKGPHP